MGADGSVRPANVDSYEQHLVTDTVVDPSNAAPRDRFEAFARSNRLRATADASYEAEALIEGPFDGALIELVIVPPVFSNVPPLLKATVPPPPKEMLLSLV